MIGGLWSSTKQMMAVKIIHTPVGGKTIVLFFPFLINAGVRYVISPSKQIKRVKCLVMTVTVRLHFERVRWQSQVKVLLNPLRSADLGSRFENCCVLFFKFLRCRVNHGVLKR